MTKLDSGGSWIAVVALLLVGGVAAAVWLAGRGGATAPEERRRGPGPSRATTPASAQEAEPEAGPASYSLERKPRTPAERRAIESGAIFGTDPASMHRSFMSFEFICEQAPRAVCDEGRRLAPRCGSADMAACVAVAELLDSAKHADALYFRAAACELGHQPSCVRWDRLHELDLAYRRSGDDVGTPDDLVDQCRAGDAEACATQSHIESANQHPIDLEAARRGCDAGFVSSCIALVEGSGEPEVTARVFERLCEREQVQACKMLHAMYRGDTIWDEWPAPPPDPIAAARMQQRIALLTGKPWAPPPRLPDDEGDDE